MKGKQSGLNKKNQKILKRQRDFLLLKKEGKTIRKGGFFLTYRKNQLSHCRFAFLFPRWTGKAVQRNRFKRWARHFLKEKQWPVPLDLLLGFEKKEKDFYKKINYKQFCQGFEAICQGIEI